MGAYIEPQYFVIAKGVKRNVLDLCNNGVSKINLIQSKRGIMRVDNKILKRFCTDPNTGITYTYAQYLESKKSKISTASNPSTFVTLPCSQYTTCGKP